MKKMIGILSVICAVVSLTACTGKPAEVTEEGFAPALDTNTDCSITVAGSKP